MQQRRNTEGERRGCVSSPDAASAADVAVPFTADELAQAVVALHPLGLVFREGASYLVATAFEYVDVRLYALHRMRSASLSDRRARRLPGFDLDAFIAAGDVGWRLSSEPVVVELAFHDGAERRSSSRRCPVTSRSRWWRASRS
jgi:hypothetical protein